jgi:hypothetical protein
MHWGEDDEEDSSSEEDQPTTDAAPTTSTTTAPTSLTPPATLATAPSPTPTPTPTTTTTTTTTTSSTPQPPRPRTASVEDLYRSLDPTTKEITSFVEAHGPFAGTMMATAKPLSRVLREKLAELLAEQEQLLGRIGAQRTNMKQLPQMVDIVSTMDRVPEYQKKLQWIKNSMQRTQTMVDQLKKQSLSMQAQVQKDVVKAAEKKKAERRQDEQMKAKVVVSSK